MENEFTPKALKALAKDINALAEADQGDMSSQLYTLSVARMNEGQVAQLHEFLYS